ncbi:MAG: hypothetical protein EOM91_23500 [Sphingobacteriia bacterium]|nr:hypothetical protein [Sphingobacteriia bacterium]
MLVYREDARFMGDDQSFPETKTEGRRLFGLIDGQWHCIEVLDWCAPEDRVQPGETLPPDDPWTKSQLVDDRDYAAEEEAQGSTGNWSTSFDDNGPAPAG